MLTTAVVYKWRITNAKYIYLIDEEYGEPFIYYINDEMRIYSDGHTEYKKADEIIIKEIVSSFDEEGAYKDAFEKMSGLLKSDEDGRYLHLLDYSAYLKDIPECVEGATDVTCNPIDIVFTADAKSLPSGDTSVAVIEDVEDIQLPNGSRQRKFNINFGIPAGKDGKDGKDGKSAFEIAREQGFTGTTEEEWVLSLKGDKGDSIKGPQGDTGKSAYDIAWDQGFRGTETEWVLSLKGDKGDDGTIGVNKVQEEIIYKILGYDTSSNDSNISYFPYVYNKFISKPIEGESDPGILFYFSSADINEYKRTYYLTIQFGSGETAECVVNPINGYNNYDGLCLCYNNKSYDGRMNFYYNGTFIYTALSSNSLTKSSFEKLHSIYETTEKGEYEKNTIIKTYDKDNREICLFNYDGDISYAKIIEFSVVVDETPLENSKNDFIVDKFDKISIKPESELNSNIKVSKKNIVTGYSDITQKLDNTSIQHYVLESEEIGYKSTMQFNAKSLNIELLKNKDNVCNITIGNDNFESTDRFKVTSKLATFKPEVQAKVNDINDVYLGVPIGTIVMWPLEKAPKGWLICDGSPCSINVYNKLFSVIGFTYGGNKVVGFKVPNLVEKFPLGAANRDPYKLGVTGGTEEVALTKSQMPKHKHTIQEIGSYKNNGGSDFGTFSELKTSNKTDVDRKIKVGYTNMSEEGLGLPHNNMPPFLTLNFIIKYM